MLGGMIELKITFKSLTLPFTCYFLQHSQETAEINRGTTAIIYRKWIYSLPARMLTMTTAQLH